MRCRMVALGLCGVLLLPPAAGADDGAERLAAARAYIEATGGFAVQLAVTIEALATQLPEEHQAPFAAFMEQALDPAEIENLAVDGMARHFTAAEIEALADFYGSQPGRSIAAKFPAFFAEAMAEVRALVAERARTFEP